MPSGQEPGGKGHSRPGQQDRHSRAPACPVFPWPRGKERARQRIWHLALSTRRPGHKKWSFSSRGCGETLLTRVPQTDGLDRVPPAKEVTPQYAQGDPLCTAVRAGLLPPSQVLASRSFKPPASQAALPLWQSQGCSCWVCSLLSHCPRANPTMELVFSLQQRTQLHRSHTSLLSQAAASHLSSPRRHSVLPVWLDFQESKFRHILHILAKSSLWCFSCEKTWPGIPSASSAFVF